MDRRRFVQSAVVAPLVLGSLSPSFGDQPAPGPRGKGPDSSLAGSSNTPVRDRYEVTLRRILSGVQPEYTEAFLLEDVRPTPGRRFTEFSGDVSGRYIGALATASLAQGARFPGLDSLVEKVIALQKPEGYFGSTFHFDRPTDDDLALLWGNGRLLVGLIEYYRLVPKPAVLAACVRLGDFLVRIGPLMLSATIREAFGAQHFASSYICWTQQTEGLANLYMVTQDVRYSKLAKEIFAVTERRPGDHVHGYLSSLRGAMDLYRATRDPAILAKCEAAWLDITQSPDLLITGGVPEGWSPNNHRTEGCGEVDWLRLNLMLWKATGNPRYLTMAERTTFNEFSFNQFASGDFGHRVFTDTGIAGAGAVRAWWCCTLHGLRCFPDIQGSVLREEKGVLNFDLPVDGRLETADFSVTAVSSLATDGHVQITLGPGKSGKAMPAMVRIRKPEWAEAVVVRVNNAVSHPLIQDGYMSLQKEWLVGDVVSVQYGMALRSQASGKGRVSYSFGPWLLGAPASENPAYFNELTTDNRLLDRVVVEKTPLPAGHVEFAVPIALTVFRYTPAEFPEQPSTVTLRALAEQGGQQVTSWEVRFLTQDGA